MTSILIADQSDSTPQTDPALVENTHENIIREHAPSFELFDFEYRIIITAAK